MTDKQSIQDVHYLPLRTILDDAYRQAAEGKGKERHANGRAFDKQPIAEIARMTGEGGPAFQVLKKTQEAVSLAGRGDFRRAEAELLGAINYAAAAVMILREKEVSRSSAEDAKRRERFLSAAAAGSPAPAGEPVIGQHPWSQLADSDSGV